MVPDAMDVAANIIEAATDVDQMKLHKLLYFAQAWHLAWYGEPMFEGRIEAWQFGPYVPRVGRIYSGEGYERQPIPRPLGGNAAALDDRRQVVLLTVVQAYDGLTGRELATLSKQDAPWREARGDIPDDDPNCREEITPESLTAFYRKSGRFGAHPPVVEVRDELLARASRGDRAAVTEALDEAVGIK